VDPTTLGTILGAAAVVVFVAFKLFDRFAPPRQGAQALSGCPLNADPELKALIVKLTDAQTMALNVLASNANLLRELHTDHEVQKERMAEIRRALYGRPDDAVE
jgi:hypothetical protein